MICEYCNNQSGIKDNIGGCISCGAPNRVEETEFFTISSGGTGLLTADDVGEISFYTEGGDGGSIQCPS